MREVSQEFASKGKIIDGRWEVESRHLRDSNSAVIMYVLKNVLNSLLEVTESQYFAVTSGKLTVDKIIEQKAKHDVLKQVKAGAKFIGGSSFISLIDCSKLYPCSINAQTSTDQKIWLDKRCKEFGVTIAEYVRMLIGEDMEACDAEKLCEECKTEAAAACKVEACICMHCKKHALSKKKEKKQS